METTDPQPDPQTPAQQLREHLAGMEECQRQRQEERDRQQEEHAEYMARMEALKAEQDVSIRELQALRAELNAIPPLKPADLTTTIAQVRSMAQKDVHPTWMHAAYADLVGRMERLRIPVIPAT